MKVAMAWGVRPDEWWRLEGDVKSIMIATVRTRDTIANMLAEVAQQEREQASPNQMLAAIRARTSRGR